MKFITYFPWMKKERTYSFFNNNDSILTDAITEWDINGLGRVFAEKPKCRDEIAARISKSVEDEKLLDFVKKFPESMSHILSWLGLHQRIPLAKFIINELDGWPLSKDVNSFIFNIIEDTEFLKNLLTKNKLKPSIIILNFNLTTDQADALLQVLTDKQLISLLADCETDSPIINKSISLLQTRGQMTSVFSCPIDSHGNTLLHLASPLIINKLAQETPLPTKPILNAMGLNALEYTVFTGNFAMASYLTQFNLPFNTDVPTQFITEALIYGLELSEDKYKHNSIAHLLKQANIELPADLAYIHPFINNRKSCQFKDMASIKPYLCLLVDYYLKRCSQDGKEVRVLIQETMNAINHDFALEVLCHAGYRPEPLTKPVTVFRGAVGPLDEHFIQSFLDLGYHSSFTFKNGNKYARNSFLNYTTKSSCIDDNAIRYEFTGNFSYFSENPFHSLNVYAKNRMNAENNTAFLIEARLEAGAPKVVGANSHEFEYITPFIEPYNIKAIHIINKSGVPNKTLHNPRYVPDTTEIKCSFFERGENNIDWNTLMESKKGNELYYHNEFAHFKRPSSYNGAYLKFDKKLLPQFLEASHDALKQYTYALRPSIGNTLHSNASSSTNSTEKHMDECTSNTLCGTIMHK